MSGAGKTTLVSELHEFRDTLVLHIDDYIVERSKRYDTGHSEAMEYYALQWDVDGLVRQLFRPLHEGLRKLTLMKYDQEHDKVHKQMLDVSPCHVVVVEGIFLQRPEWRPYFDHVIYLDCPHSVRYERVLQRDTYIGDLEARLQKYRRRYWPGEDYYLKTVLPWEGADVIVTTNSDN